MGDIQMNDKKYCVYMHTNKINGKKYIGQTCRTLESRSGRSGKGYIGCSCFYNAIKKYGWHNFNHEILFNNLSLEEANRVEQIVISLFKSNNKFYGYNLQSGGKNFEVSEETKLKFREIYIGENNPFYGKHHSLETKQTMSKKTKGKYKGANNPFYGKKHTEEARKIMSQKHYDCKGTKNPNFGRKHTECSKEKMRTSRIGKPILQYDLNGNFIKEWEYMSLARKEYNLDKRSLQKACNGILKTTGGYIWKYKE